jgi:predicted PurR-regulated permease PerM
MTIRRSDIVFFFALLLGLYLAWLVRDVLLLVYMSALFAVVFSPGVRFIRRMHIRGWRPSRGLAILILLLSGIVVMAFFAVFMLPPIFRDLHGLATYAPDRMAAALEKLHRIPYVGRLDITALQEHLAAAAGGVVGVFTGIAGGLFWFFSWMILTAYFILDGDRAFHWLMSLFPDTTRQRLEPTMMRAEARVRNWLAGQGALMLILGLCSLVTFWLLKIRYFYALALFAGLANIVPVVGPLASVVLAGTVAAFDSWTKLLGVLIFYFVYQQVENAYLTPRIMKTTVDLPPLAIIIALSLGGSLAGVLGALIAVPSAALAAVFIEEYVVKPSQQERMVGTGA